MFGVSMILIFVGLNPFCNGLVGSRSIRLRADVEPTKENHTNRLIKTKNKKKMLNLKMSNDHNPKQQHSYK